MCRSFGFESSFSLCRLLRLFFFYGYGDHRDLHVLTLSFPTRRSSDLVQAGAALESYSTAYWWSAGFFAAGAVLSVVLYRRGVPEAADPRSEEHTSELQSLMRSSYAVFCLKKKRNKASCNTNTNERAYIVTSTTEDTSTTRATTA